MATFTSSTFGKYTGGWLIGTAIFELVLSAGFFVFGLSSGIAGLTMTGVILGIVGIVLLVFGIGSRKKAAEADRIDQTGLAGTAQITGMTQTGMYLNNNPQIGLNLMVAVPGRNPYPIEVKQFIPLMLLGSLSVGRTLPVKVDQQDPGKVVIDWDGGAQVTGGIGQWGGAMPGAAMPMQGGVMPGGVMVTPAVVTTSVNVASQGNVDQLRAQLAATGLDGTGTILQAQDMGVAIGASKLFSVQMAVNVPGKAPYQETSAAVVPADDAPKLVTGANVPVKVSSDNPSLVMIQWDRI
ncbi:MAG: hypothetical protein ACJ77A_03160 [Actinomycetota bacterium]